MRSLWTEIKYVKSAARLLDRDCINKRGLDLSKEVLWISVGQRAAELQAFKVGDQNNIFYLCYKWFHFNSTYLVSGQIFFLLSVSMKLNCSKTF